MEIERVEDLDILQGKIDDIFIKQAANNNIDSNYQHFAYAVKNDKGEILGGIHGYRLFKEVYVGELSLDEKVRGQGIGRKLLGIVEKEICNDATDFIVLTTNAFQKAIEFYKKCGFEIEFVRKNKDPRFDKYSMIKKLRWLL